MRKLNNKKGFVPAIVVGVFSLGLITSALVQGYGTEPVKNCPGTHVNDNCAHMRIEDL